MTGNSQPSRPLLQPQPLLAASPSSDTASKQLSTAGTSADQAGSTAQTLPSGNGITSRDYSFIPPRPKPGRKPATDSPATKRKEQNREAQRAYRARKAQQCDELEDELTKKANEWSQKEASWQQQFEEQTRAHIQADANHRAYAASLERQLADTQAKCSRLEDDIHRLNRELGAARAHRFSDGSMTSYPSRGSWSQPVTPGTFEQSQSRPSIRHSRPGSQEHLSKKTFNPTCRKCEGGGPCVCLQEGLSKTSIGAYDSSSNNMEIDFTTVSKKRTSTAAGLPDRSSNASIQQTPQADSCGFCTDRENCICAMADRQEPTASDQAPPASAFSPGAHQPGGCDRCIADPERARWCRMLAQEVPLSSTPSPPTSTNQATTAMPTTATQRLPSLQSQNLLNIDSRTSMSCDEAYDEFTKRHTSVVDRQADGLRFVKQLKARPAAGAGGSTGAASSSAFEVDMASVLTAMKDSGDGRTSREG